MIHIIKSYKWVIASSLISILFGLLTFFTFIDHKLFIKIKNITDLKSFITVDAYRDEEEKEVRLSVFSSYQGNEQLVKFAKDDFLFMHDMPAHRGE